MANRIGARAVYTPSKELTQFLESMRGRLGDPTQVNQKIGLDARAEVLERLAAGGDGDWPSHTVGTIERWGKHPLGVLSGGFGPTIRAFWDARGAGWFTRAAHAHLFDLGTVTHHSSSGRRVNVFGEGGRHLSRAASRKRLLSTTSRVYEQARPFGYLSDALIERSGERVTRFFLQGTVE